MSSILPPLPMTQRRSLPEAASRPAWWREPMLHFALLGGVLFGVDHLLVSRADDPRTIVLGANVDFEARRIFAAARGHAPSADELAALRGVWLNNEVLYREGLAMQVDRGDTAIRERVIFKALSVIDANVKLPPFDDRVLRAWFEAHRVKYDEPPRFDFQEAALSGDAPEAEVRAFVGALNAGTPGDAKAGLRVFKGRPQASLAPSYGAEFAHALEQAPPGEWRAQPTQGGWRAIRLDTITSARPADFESLRGVVLQDWTDATLAGQRSAAVRVLAKKYTLKIEGTPS
ncbi:MAG: peptidylprolyl isomerase [Caldimonas sp.]